MMYKDIESLIEQQTKLLLQEKARLGLTQQKPLPDIKNVDGEEPLPPHVASEDKENHAPLKSSLQDDILLLDLEEEPTKDFGTGSPLVFRSDENKRAMLRFGEYSPNNPQYRVTAAPYLGLGEYEQRRNVLLQKQRADYLEHLAKKNENLNTVIKKSNFEEKKLSKAVQTDIQNIHSRLVQYELQNSSEIDYDRIGASANRNFDQRLAQNALLRPEMTDKPKSILSNRRTGSPRERLLADLQHSYTPSFMDGFSYQDTEQEVERERLKREIYKQELRQQIEEKRRLQALKEERERREQELENRRLEQQLLRMQEESMLEEQRRTRREEMRRNSDDYMRRKHEVHQSRANFRKHSESESGAGSSLRRQSPLRSHYSPPVTRRHHYSYNVPSTSTYGEASPRYQQRRFDLPNGGAPIGRYDSLGRIDALDRQDALNRFESLSIQEGGVGLGGVQRRHSATQQDLRKSPRLQRRSSSSRFDEVLPTPVLKAHSPVARELKNSVPFNSTVTRQSDRWQKNEDGGKTRSILTQLGAIRMQLQREQLRMDEKLRKRDTTQSKAVDFH